MVCRRVLRSVLTTEAWMMMIPPLHPNRAIIYSLSPTRKVGFLSSKTTSIRAPEFHHFGRTKPALVNCFCSYNNEADQDQDPPREAVLKAISGLYYLLLTNSSCNWNQSDNQLMSLNLIQLVVEVYRGLILVASLHLFLCYDLLEAYSQSSYIDDRYFS